jgi:uncharacterized protein YgiM (DUF1202 family)
VQKGSSVTLSVSSGSSAETTVEGVDTGMVITGDVPDLIVRRSASMDSDIIGYVDNGSYVSIVGSTGSGDDVWYQIEFDGGFGYVPADFIAVQ